MASTVSLVDAATKSSVAHSYVAMHATARRAATAARARCARSAADGAARRCGPNCARHMRTQRASAASAVAATNATRHSRSVRARRRSSARATIAAVTSAAGRNSTHTMTTKPHSKAWSCPWPFWGGFASSSFSSAAAPSCFGVFLACLRSASAAAAAAASRAKPRRRHACTSGTAAAEAAPHRHAASARSTLMRRFTGASAIAAAKAPRCRSTCSSQDSTNTAPATVRRRTPPSTWPVGIMLATLLPSTKYHTGPTTHTARMSHRWPWKVEMPSVQTIAEATRIALAAAYERCSPPSWSREMVPQRAMWMLHSVSTKKRQRGATTVSFHAFLLRSAMASALVAPVVPVLPPMSPSHASAIHRSICECFVTMNRTATSNAPIARTARGFCFRNVVAIVAVLIGSNSAMILASILAE